MWESPQSLGIHQTTRIQFAKFCSSYLLVSLWERNQKKYTRCKKINREIIYEFIWNIFSSLKRISFLTNYVINNLALGWNS